MARSIDEISEFPLCWPDGKPRTSRREHARFDTSLAKARGEIEREMPLWKSVRYVISMAPAYRRSDYDPGVAVWWVMSDKSGKSDLRVLACDKYTTPEDNAHAIALTLRGLRSFERYGTYTLRQAAEGARLFLPSPATERAWWETLGVERNWPLAAIEQIYRAKAEKIHPDKGGDPAEMAALTAAIGAARREKNNAASAV